MIYERMLSEHQRLESAIQSIDLKLSQLPKGKFYIAGNNNYEKWYHVKDSKRIYIPKKKRTLAEQLATAKYLALHREDLLQEKRAIEFYLKHHNSEKTKAEVLLSNTPAYSELIAPHFKPSSQELLEWMNSPYEQNPMNPDKLNIKTISGKFVRSKSEALIEMSLYMHKIPYRYECILSFPDWTCYPDFTIRHPETGELYYWEHLGMMDNPDYAKKAFRKMHDYIDHEIIPNVHLILTFETKNHPLSSAQVEQITNQFFL